MRKIKGYISLIIVVMLVLSVPHASFAVTDDQVDMSENSTVIDLSGMSDGNAVEGELLVLVDEGTSKRKVSAIAEEAGASLENISTLNDGTKLAKVSLDDEENVQIVAEDIASDDAVLIVQPNHIYHLEEAEEATPEESEGDTGNPDEINPDTDEESNEKTDAETIDEAVEEDEMSTGAEDEASNEEASTSDQETAEPEPEENTALEEAPPDSATAEKKEVSDRVEGSGTVKATTLSQWHLENNVTGATNARNAWTKLSSSGEVKVAVIDTGVDLAHRDLKNNILVNKCVSFRNGRQGSFTDWDGADDDNGHGTEVCGIIAARTGDNYGVDGIANNRAKLIVIDAADPSDLGFSTQDIVLAIDYAVDNGAEIINLSVGSLYSDYIEEKALNDATDSGVLCVCASGNEATDLPESPGDSGVAISVISHGKSGTISSFSNYGVYKDVSAPGEDIVSTDISGVYGDDFCSSDGTSMAAPVVTGLAALIKSEKSNLGPREIKNYIYTSSGSRSFQKRGAGFGRINAYNAVDSVNRAAAEPDEIVLNSTALSLCSEEEFDLEYAVYPATASTHADELTFNSSDDKVVSVDKNGRVTAKAQGTAYVTASCRGIEAVCEVTVKDIAYKTINCPFRGIGAFTSSDHRLTATRTIDNSTEVYEALVNGYQMNLKNNMGRIAIRVLSDYVIPSVRVFDPYGSDVPVSQTYTSNGVGAVCYASFRPKSSGVYKIQLLGDLLGEEPDSSGRMEYHLSVDAPNDIGNAEISNIKRKSYTGKSVTQKPVVVMNGKTLKKGTDYKLTYSGNVKVGTASVTIKGIGDYYGSQKKYFRIKKAANGLKVKIKKYTIKRSKLKKKARTISAAKLMSVSGANGKIKYSKVSGSSKLSINKSTGAVTIKKKTKKGTYKMVAAVTASGDNNHLEKTKKVTLVVKVK